MRTGDPPTRGKSRIDRGGEPTPSPTAHLAGQTGCFEVRGAPAIHDIVAESSASSGAISPWTCSRAVGVGVSLALVTTLLPTIARRGGLEPLGLAALAAAPFVANLLGVFAGRFGPRSSWQLALIRGAGSASLVLLFIVPTPPIMVAVSVLYWISLSFGGPFHLRLWGAMYPARLRGRIVGMIGMGRAAATALAAFGGGLLADRVGGPPAVALAGLIGIDLRVGYAGLRARAARRPAPVLRT